MKDIVCNAYYAPGYLYNTFYSTTFGHNQYLSPDWTDRDCEASDYQSAHHPRIKYDTEYCNPADKVNWNNWAIYTRDNSAYPNDPVVRYDSVERKEFEEEYDEPPFETW